MNKKTKHQKLQVLDIVGVVAAAVYVQSVLTVAHHTSFMTGRGASFTVGPPAIPALVVALGSVLYVLNKNKYKFTALSIITLSVVATASIFWLSGLRTNFYF